ncbi:hypothetical protein QTP88_007630 [Uroleucon formosanum]
MKCKLRKRKLITNNINNYFFSNFIPIQKTNLYKKNYVKIPLYLILRLYFKEQFSLNNPVMSFTDKVAVNPLLCELEPPLTTAIM